MSVFAMTRNVALALGLATLGVLPSFAGEGVTIPAPAQDEIASGKTETAILAGGCFWGVQGVFQHVNGVISATSGYAGGGASTAMYDSVGSGATGHAESVKIVFDPNKISYGHLLQIYFSVVHNPTELNRQGPDSGSQYRSTIFVTNAAQAQVAKAYIGQLNGAGVFGAPIVTTIESGKTFYKAEDYHQDYLALNPNSGYIAVNDIPKVQDLKVMFPGDYRNKPVLVLN